MIDLNSVVPADSDGNMMRLWGEFIDINRTGQIVGEAEHEKAEMHAVLLTPPGPVIPGGMPNTGEGGAPTPTPDRKSLDQVP